MRTLRGVTIIESIIALVLISVGMLATAAGLIAAANYFKRGTVLSSASAEAEYYLEYTSARAKEYYVQQMAVGSTDTELQQRNRAQGQADEAGYIDVTPPPYSADSLINENYIFLKLHYTEENGVKGCIVTVTVKYTDIDEEYGKDISYSLFTAFE